MTPRELARALGGDATHNGALVPGPGHSAKDRSLSVTLDPDAREGFVVHSWAGDDWRTCRDYVRGKLGWPCGDGFSERRRIPPARPHTDTDVQRRIAHARRIIDRAGPL